MAKWDRRQFLRGVMAAVAQMTASVAVASELPRRGSVRAVEPTPLPVTPHTQPTSSPADARIAAPAPDGMSHELGSILPPGQRFGQWRVVAVHAVKMGAVPIILETRSGTRFQVDVLRRDGPTRARRGISETRSHALYLANVGRGSTPTPEEHGLGVMWLAALLRAREHHVRPPTLLTLRDRLTRFPDGKFNSLNHSPTGSAVDPIAQTSPKTPQMPVT
jgi:hypothetical protein